MGPLDREKVKNLGGPANATHLHTLLSPVTSRLRVSTGHRARRSSHQRLPVEANATQAHVSRRSAVPNGPWPKAPRSPMIG